MAKKRALQDAVADPLTRKQPESAVVGRKIRPLPPDRRRPVFWQTVATLCIGLVGGAVLGRFLKWP